MPLEYISVIPEEGNKHIPPNFEIFTFVPDSDEDREFWNSNPKILDSGIALFICQSGEGKLVIDMNTFDIRRGSFCILLPFTVIQIVEYTEDMQVMAITAGINFLEKLSIHQPVEDYATLIQQNPCIVLNEKQLEELKQFHSFINKRLLDKNRPLANEIQETLFMYVGLEVVSLYARLKPVEKRKLSRQEQIFRNFTFSLSKHIRDHRNVEFYAEEACLTPRHFSTVIKKKSGRLPIQWITERTIILIKFLLENSEMTIQEISNELNFPNQSFFSRYFKKHTGLTPKAYRAGHSDR